MAAATNCNLLSRVCIIIINIILMIFGLCLMILGIVLHVNVKKVLINAGITNYTGGVGELLGSFDDAAIVCIVCGVLICLIAILGCVAGIIQNKCILVTYALLTAILIILLIISTVLIFGGYLTHQVKSHLEDTIRNYYVGSLRRITTELGYTTDVTEDTTGRSNALDAIMASLQCCGLYNSTDFEIATKWKASKVTVTAGGATVVVKIPVACCKKFAVPPVAANVPELRICVTAPTTTNSYMDVGCWPKLEATFYLYRTPGVAIMILLILFLLALFCMTLYLLCSTLETDSEPNYYDDRAQQQSDQSKKRKSDMYLPNYQSRENQFNEGPYGRNNRNFDDQEYGSRPTNYAASQYAGSQASTPDWYSPNRSALPRVMPSNNNFMGAMNGGHY